MPNFAPEDMSMFAEDFGEPATFTRRGSTGASVVAVFDEGKFLGAGGDVGEDADEVMRPGLGNYTVIFLPRTTVPQRPLYQDTVTREDGEVFTILQVRDEDGMWKCWAVSDERGAF